MSKKVMAVAEVKWSPAPKSFQEIYEDYKAGKYDYKPDGPVLQKVPDDYIFDEELSVKRNREMVAEHNQKVADQKKEIRDGRFVMDKKLQDDCITYAMYTYTKFSWDMCKTIYDKVYADKHHSMYEFFWMIEEAFDFVEDMITMYKKGENL